MDPKVQNDTAPSNASELAKDLNLKPTEEKRVDHRVQFGKFYSRYQGISWILCGFLALTILVLTWTVNQRQEIACPLPSITTVSGKGISDWWTLSTKQPTIVHPRTWLGYPLPPKAVYDGQVRYVWTGKDWVQPK